jgi:hypothetical protein
MQNLLNFFVYHLFISYFNEFILFLALVSEKILYEKINLRYEDILWPSRVLREIKTPNLKLKA